MPYDLTPPVPRLTPNHLPWKAMGVVLGVLIALGTIVGAVGRAFYVTREEFTTKVTTDAISNTSLNESVRNLNNTLHEQKGSFDRNSIDFDQVKTDIAVIKVRLEKGRR